MSTPGRPGVVPAQLHELPSVPTTDADDADWKPIGYYSGVSSFGINAFLASNVGQHLVGVHDEAGSGQEEVYVVLRGQVLFSVGGDEHVLEAPAFVAITDPSVRRSARAASANAVLVAIGRTPEGTFETTWDTRHTEGLARHPDARGVDDT